MEPGGEKLDSLHSSILSSSMVNSRVYAEQDSEKKTSFPLSFFSLFPCFLLFFSIFCQYSTEMLNVQQLIFKKNRSVAFVPRYFCTRQSVPKTGQRFFQIRLVTYVAWNKKTKKCNIIYKIFHENLIFSQSFLYAWQYLPKIPKMLLNANEIFI